MEQVDKRLAEREGELVTLQTSMDELTKEARSLSQRLNDMRKDERDLVGKIDELKELKELINDSG